MFFHWLLLHIFLPGYMGMGRNGSNLCFTANPPPHTSKICETKCSYPIEFLPPPIFVMLFSDENYKMLHKILWENEYIRKSCKKTKPTTGVRGSISKWPQNTASLTDVKAAVPFHIFIQHLGMVKFSDSIPHFHISLGLLLTWRIFSQ